MPELLDAATNLGVALGLGAAIGLERQWRQRLAGLRTNTLVALGAASFVVFAELFPGEASPTRVAAQVVSGIGFLGAGIIFREGVNVRGLNTAATLWCSAAVGLLAGAGAWDRAAIAAALVILVNVALRPVLRFIQAQPAPEGDRSYLVTVVSRGEAEAHVRALLLQGVSAAGLRLRRLDSQNIEGSDRIEVEAEVAGPGPGDASIEQIIGRLSLEPQVTAARWRLLPAGGE
ncbi:MAG: MgtC/SapB family protein [Sphingomonadaceae bacterium]|uniref:MgtC/SapB family protein n=1 Tax=Thermaurantiacus sp. TaxID=2820283 RepID=UPI00298EE816|nr:MgtC/SapB family protein [Thermaurantiacus sp.]MCS6986029.1 MgtC/SapB family protein [Sphingomonadaceae bacterium]MDW8414755.1 MgtC/SapB family protein [Thermaurantiacus sp.]